MEKTIRTGNWKRAFALIVIAGMILAGVPTLIASAAEPDGYLWIEAEDGTGSETFNIDSPVGVSGTSILVGQGVLAQAPAITMNFNAAAADYFDVWALMATGCNSSLNFSINNGTAISVKPASSENYVYQQGVFGETKNVTWVKIDTMEAISQGANSIVCSVSDFTGGGFYQGALDCVVLVPHSWGWTASATSLAKPVPPADAEYAWVEAENGKYSYFTSNSLPEASGGNYLLGHQWIDSDPVVDMSFYIGNEAYYDVWVLMATGSSRMDFSINDGSVINVSPTAATAGVYTLGLFGVEKTISWVKIATQILPKGSNTINCAERSFIPGGYQGSIDCVVCVPASWCWTADATKIQVPQKNVLDYGICEAEQGTYNYFVRADSGLASGGASLVSQGFYEGNPFVEMEMPISNAGYYDLWALVATGSGCDSKLTFTAGGDTLELTPSVAETPCVYQYVIWGVNTNVAWKKIGRVYLEDDMNTITCTMSERYYGGFHGGLDCVVAVPSKWNYTPDQTSLKLPEAPLGKFAWLECETPDNALPADTVKYTEQENGYTIIVDMATHAQPYTFNYSFDLSGTEPYDIWYLGTEGIQGSFSVIEWNIDSEEQSGLINEPGVNTGAVVHNYYGAFPAFWQMAASEKIISAGSHTLDLTFNLNQSNVVRYAADTVLIVPSSWGWKPSSSANYYGCYDAATLDSLEVYKHLEARYGQGTTNNLILPLNGSAGSRMSYTSLTTNSLSNTGVVTRPAYNEANAIAVLDITAAKSKAADSQELIFYVLADKYEYKNFGVTYSDGSEIGATLKGGKTVKASAGVRLNAAGTAKGALLIVAIYNNAGVLCGLKSGSIGTLTSDYQTVTASLTLPQTVNGYTLKAYLWDGWGNMDPYATELIY